MRKTYHIVLLLVCLLAGLQTAWAENDVVFTETFDTNNGTGGRDDKYDDNIASSTAKFDNDGWTIAIASDDKKKVYGAKCCIRIGDSSKDGSCTTPTITISGTQYALLTFSAAGWGSGTNTLTVTTSNGNMTGDTNVTLENGEWLDYSVLVKLTSGSTMQLTFSGKRLFLDDVVVRNLETITAPTLPESCLFWPNTTETPSKSIAITVPDFTTVHYTTDGSTPTTSNGKELTASSSITIHETTTVKAIAFIGTMTSDVVTATYTLGTTVNSIADFKNQVSGTEARLYLSDERNARVLHQQHEKCWLRDNTGAICLDFGTTAAFNPTPQHNQHVAGWMIGKYQIVNGMSTFVATSNTTTDYIAFAEPVTETATAPVSISKLNVDAYRSDWVEIQNVNVGAEGEVVVNDDFSTITITPAYNGALVDLSGIVTAPKMVAPVSYNTPLVYVIDEGKAFTSPASDISGATVRLVRTLNSSYWNTFAVPFDITTMDGQIREFDHMDGNTMKFADAASIEAGKPYLVKPTANIENPVYENVTLSATAAQEVTDGGFSFVATYSPVNLKTDKTEQFLKTDGQLYYPTNKSNQMKGMRAFFRVPQGASAHVAIDGEETGIGSVRCDFVATDEAIYDLQGRKVNGQLKKGIYIMNGKKVVRR